MNEFRPKNGLLLPEQTASKVLTTDANSKVVSSSVSTTTLGYLDATSSIQTQLDNKADEANPILTGAIDASASTNIDLATTNTASTIDIGTGTGANTINIGGTNTQVNLYGSVVNQNVTNLNVTDKLTTINKGGAASSGFNSGVEIEEGGSVTAYATTTADRNGWKFKAPNNAGIATLTIGASDDDVVLNNSSATLTNKTLTSPIINTPTIDVATLDGQASTPANPSSGNYKMYVSDSTQKLTILNSAGVATTVGSGTGSNNYLTTENDGSAIGDFVTYADTTATSPVDGTGGSPTVTYATSSDASINGSNNFLFTHTASNQQGQGFSILKSIDAGDRGKVLRLSFDYKIASGTYADNDLTIWFYDATNATLIQGAPYQIKNSGIVERFYSEVQVPSSCASLRIIFHVATSTATAYTMRFDNFVFGQQAKLYGSPITDWIAYTPTGTLTTNVTYAGYWRRSGDSMEVTARISFSGANTQGAVSLNLPSGYTIDTTKTTAASNVVFGSGRVYDASTDQGYDSEVIYSSTTAVRMSRGDTTAGSAADTSVNRPITFAASDTVDFNFKVPILGWSSSQIMSSDADTRVVAFNAYGATATITGSLSDVTWSTTSRDTHGAFNGTTSYTTPSPGWYEIDVSLRTALTVGAVDQVSQIELLVDGVGVADDLISAGSTSQTKFINKIRHKQYFTAGQVIKVQVLTNATSASISASNTYNRFSVNKIQGPAQIAANETIACSYNMATAQTLASSATVKYDTKQVDTHNSFNTATGVFTAPSAGLYRASAALFSITATSAWNFGLRKNNSMVTRAQPAAIYSSGTSIASQQSNGLLVPFIVRLSAGDTLDFYISSPSAAGTIYASTIDSYMTIERIGI